MLLFAANDMGGEVVGGIVLSFFAGMIVVGYFSARARRARAKSPKLAGSAIPELDEGIDLSRRYDITCSGEWHSDFVQRFENVRIIGYVGSDNDETVGKMYMRG